jgi:hypothetical protein
MARSVPPVQVVTRVNWVVPCTAWWPPVLVVAVWVAHGPGGRVEPCRIVVRALMNTHQQVADAAGLSSTALGARDAVQQRSTATVEPEPEPDGRY